MGYYTTDTLKDNETAEDGKVSIRIDDQRVKCELIGLVPVDGATYALLRPINPNSDQFIVRRYSIDGMNAVVPPLDDPLIEARVISAYFSKTNRIH